MGSNTRGFSNTKEKWNAAVKRHELPWLHVLNGEGTNDVAELYGFQAYPTYVLIAPDGKVLQWMSDDPDTFDLYFNDQMLDKETSDNKEDVRFKKIE